ncbi:MAG: hypothetical protein K2K93_09195 [Muribaculaceae bacterium]|nr:hypothetical protein [Muribaculaceae bacterium]
MARLDKVLDQTNGEIKIDVASSKTAQSEILRRYRRGFTCGLIFVLVYVIMMISGITPSSFPVSLNITLVASMLAASCLYAVLYHFLKKIDIATLTPAELIRKTARFRIISFTSTVCLFVIMAILMFWQSRGDGDIIFYIAVSFSTTIVIYIIKQLPEEKKLFREMNSEK